MNTEPDNSTPVPAAADLEHDNAALLNENQRLTAANDELAQQLQELTARVEEYRRQADLQAARDHLRRMNEPRPASRRFDPVLLKPLEAAIAAGTLTGEAIEQSVLAACMRAQHEIDLAAGQDLFPAEPAGTPRHLTESYEPGAAPHAWHLPAAPQQPTLRDALKNQ